MGDEQGLARPTDQALVSDEAAARLHPTGFDPSRGPWICFHCEETFSDREAAAEHFGDYFSEAPVCVEARFGVEDARGLILINRDLATRLMKVEADLEQAEFERDCWASAGRSATGNPNATWHDLRGELLTDELEGRVLAVETAFDAMPRWLSQYFRRRAERLWHRARDSDRSGEASETRSGSTVGESAGLQGIAQGAPTCRITYPRKSW